MDGMTGRALPRGRSRRRGLAVCVLAIAAITVDVLWGFTGTLTAAGGLSVDGTLRGNGTVNANVTVTGTGLIGATANAILVAWIEEKMSARAGPIDHGEIAGWQIIQKHRQRGNPHAGLRRCARECSANSGPTRRGARSSSRPRRAGRRLEQAWRESAPPCMVAACDGALRKLARHDTAAMVNHLIARPRSLR